MNRVIFDTSIFIHANYSIMMNFLAESQIDSKALASKVTDQIASIALKKFEGYDVVLALDSPYNFRKKISEQYKAQRSKKNIDTEVVEEFLKSRFNCIQYNGLEADDLIYLYSRKYPEAVLVSEDNDYLLMLDDYRIMYKYKVDKFVALDSEQDHLIECLQKICGGCKSDNISRIKLKSFGPAFLKKFLTQNPGLDLIDYLDILEEMQYILPYQRNYELAMYDEATYYKYLNETNIKNCLQWF